MITEAKEHSNAVPRNGPLEMAGLSQREYTPANEENKFTIQNSHEHGALLKSKLIIAKIIRKAYDIL